MGKCEHPILASGVCLDFDTKVLLALPCARGRKKEDDYEKALAATLKKAKADSKTVQTEYEHSQLSVRIASYAVALEMYRRYKKNGFLELAK